jgi:hypothetical protein
MPYHEAIVRELAEARITTALFTFDLYCDNVRCATRITSVDVKDDDATLLPMIRANASSFRCLICGGPLRWDGCSGR